ncbi:MAG TPA: hypothetical protein H9727_00160 [Candidatus Borkfalkia avistercoris]|uniref:Hsp70 family protein n=1 Tax=Candidatus Borkfalkia avistercoris TaxID=2838504 RepID=A0A9D2CY06_9FIRM|nr:hypothetical protein [Candidatus Borkfalkia avistercoris]
MALTLNIGLDLGSDTLKVAYAYEKSGNMSYGKLMKEGMMTEVALPAIAYYDESEKKWLFGDEVDKTEGNSFVNVVKIKSLVSLLLPSADPDVKERNRKYYFKGHAFPKFYFPVRRKMLSDFDTMVKGDMTFAAAETPQQVCEQYFAYAARMVFERIAGLSARAGVSFYKTLHVALVHPSRSGKVYVSELVRLAKKAFGAAPAKVLSSTKALSMYAFQRGMLAPGESLLVFDMGEEDISVVKASLLENGRLVVDGADGHNEPCDIGGNDVDDAVAEYIEGCIRRRETVGTPSFGTEGHINERGLHSKQYLFLKDIKKAKMILSVPLREGSVFEKGVPVAVARDLYIQRKLTREEFCACIGVAGNRGVARRIADYIIEEVSRPVNEGVKKIFLSGGLVETYSIFEYISREVKKAAPAVEFYTFDDWKNEADGYTIRSFEDSTYAPAVGGAIVALKNYELQTVIALSYATWLNLNVKMQKFLSIFVNRGTPLPPEGATFTVTSNFGQPAVLAQITNDQLYSAAITEEEIARKKYSARLPGQYYDAAGKTYLLIGNEDDDPWRLNAAKQIGLKVVSGERGATIYFYHQGTRVRLHDTRIYFREGVRIDGDGRAVPYIANAEELNTGNAYINYLTGSGSFESWSASVKKVPAREIEIRFEGMEEFSVQADD